MKKRILSFVLALVMAVSLLPVSVLAAEDAPEVQAEYVLRDSDVKVIGTYQVDEDTTWDVRLVTVDSTKYNYIRPFDYTKTGVISTEKYKVDDPETNCQGLFNQIYKKFTSYGLHHEAYA